MIISLNAVSYGDSYRLRSLPSNRRKGFFLATGAARCTVAFRSTVRSRVIAHFPLAQSETLTIGNKIGAEPTSVCSITAGVTVGVATASDGELIAMQTPTSIKIPKIKPAITLGFIVAPLLGWKDCFVFVVNFTSFDSLVGYSIKAGELIKVHWVIAIARILADVIGRVG
jgi:hypothetical protein